MADTTRLNHKFSLSFYLALSMGITWLCWVPSLIMSLQQGYIMPAFDTFASLFKFDFANTQHMLLFIAFQLGVYGPLIGGVVATWMDGGREGLADLWKRTRKWNVGGRWYLTAFAILLIITGLPVIIFSLAGGFSSSSVAISSVLFTFLMQLLTSGVGEEPGWRGFLLPRLQASFEGDKSIWLLGLIWAIWHYPLVIIQTISSMQNVSFAQIAITIVISLAGMTMSQIGLTFIYVWFYNQTQSVFLMIIFHALSNTLVYWLTSFLTNPQSVTLIIGLMPWAVVLFIEKKYGKEIFINKPSM